VVLVQPGPAAASRAVNDACAVGGTAALVSPSHRESEGTGAAASIAVVATISHVLEATGWCVLNLDREADGDRAALRDVFANEIAHDGWLPPGHDYRSRAYQCFEVDMRELRLDALDDPPPYVQSADVNRVAGGLRRHFRTLPAAHPATAVVRRLATTVLQLVLDSGIASPAQGSHLLDAHFIRTAAPGKPCPEGVHRDGLVAGSVHLVELANVRGGETELLNDAGERLERLALGSFLDSVVFDDARLLHYTTDIEPCASHLPAHRDVLLLGLRTVASE
jgi:hypothetical protein